MFSIYFGLMVVLNYYDAHMKKKAGFNLYVFCPNKLYAFYDIPYQFDRKNIVSIKLMMMIFL